MPFLFGFTWLVVLAFLTLFRFSGPGRVDFWSWLGLQIFFFCVLIFIFSRKGLQLFRRNFFQKPMTNLAIGVASAIFLYALFYFGHFLLGQIWPSTNQQIQNIYALKMGHKNWFLGVLLGLVIGPGEEFIWRWFLQREWSQRRGRWPSFFFIAFLYASAHLTAKNPVLILAALTCGLFWGYLFLRFESILANIISHSLWDLIIFVFWPIL